MMPEVLWEDLSTDAHYSADTLATEGFIHCTGERELLVTVANHFYRSAVGLFVILVIDEKKVSAEIRWEPADGYLFPHIYGPLNIDAVREVIGFPRDADGTFTQPIEWGQST